MSCPEESSSATVVASYFEGVGHYMDDKTIENNLVPDVTVSAGRKPYRPPQFIPLGHELVRNVSNSGCDCGADTEAC